MQKNVLKADYLGMLLATISGLFFSSVWYSPFLFGMTWLELRGLDAEPTGKGKMPIWRIGIELIRTIVAAYLLGHFVMSLGVADLHGALVFGASLWLGFPATVLSGSLIWDEVSLPIDVLHAGDWLTKLLIMGAILGLWAKNKLAGDLDSEF